MSKKSKLKRKKYQYTRHEFVQAVCDKCGLCKPPTTSEFCYDGVYRDNPKTFINTIMEQLIDVKRWVSSAGYPSIIACSDEHIQYVFQTIFCSSNFCGKLPEQEQSCKALAGCLHTFRKQIKGLGKDSEIFSNVCNSILMSDIAINNNIISILMSDIAINNNIIDFKSKKKQKQKYKYATTRVRTPTFFCNEKFKKEIEEIIGGDNHREQDTIEGSTGCFEEPPN